MALRTRVPPEPPEPAMRRLSAVLAVALVALLAGCSAPAEEVGTRVRTEDRPHGTAVSLVSPLGSARVVVGDPVRSIVGDAAADGKAHRAPDGGAFVPVSWGWSFAAGFPFGVLDPRGHPATISLVAGGRRYPLDTVRTTFAAAQPEYVAVATTKGLAVSLSYDGLTQTADARTGRRAHSAADPIYDVRARDVGCDAGWTASPPVDAAMECRLRVAVVPWAGAWAPAGREYVVASADLRPFPVELRDGGDVARYEVTGIVDHSALDGAAPRQPLERDPAVGYRASGTLVFEVPSGPHTLRLALDCSLRRQSQDGAGAFPADMVATLSTSVPIR